MWVGWWVGGGWVCSLCVEACARAGVCEYAARNAPNTNGVCLCLCAVLRARLCVHVRACAHLLSLFSTCARTHTRTQTHTSASDVDAHTHRILTRCATHTHTQTRTNNVHRARGHQWVWVCRASVPSPATEWHRHSRRCSALWCVYVCACACVRGFVSTRLDNLLARL